MERIFTAPFTIQAVSFHDQEEHVRDDTSFCAPEIAQFAHNFSYEHSEDAWFSDERHNMDLSLSIGVEYQMPWTGRLRLTSEIENLANRVTLAASDNYGTSTCNVAMDIDFLVSTVRDGHPPLTSSWGFYRKDWTVQEGISQNIVSLDRTTPYHSSGTDGTIYEAGERVSIYIGTRVRFWSWVDDMHLHSRVTYWWRLNKLGIEVV